MQFDIIIDVITDFNKYLLEKNIYKKKCRNDLIGETNRIKRHLFRIDSIDSSISSIESQKNSLKHFCSLKYFTHLIFSITFNWFSLFAQNVFKKKTHATDGACETCITFNAILSFTFFVHFGLPLKKIKIGKLIAHSW